MIRKETLILLFLFLRLQLFSQELRKQYVDSSYTRYEILNNRISDKRDTLTICYLNEFYPQFSNGGKIIITHHRSEEGVCGYEEINLYNEIKNKITLRYQLIKEPCEPYYFLDSPILFNWWFPKTEKFEQFIVIRAQYPGTANSSEDYIFKISSNDRKNYKIEKIEYKIQPFNTILRKDESVKKGPILDFNDSLKFINSIWIEGDANCCPSGGYIIGNFRFVKINDSYYFEIEKFKIYKK